MIADRYPELLPSFAMRMLMILALVPCAAMPAAAGPHEDGVAAYSKGDYATALRLWRPLAEQGVAAAQSSLGGMYEQGKGVPQDYAAAMFWYRKAADQGIADAQSNLGLMYSAGVIVPQDYAAAVFWYRRAAEQGQSAGQNNLGTMYARGLGVPQDFVQAHMWFNLAAAQNNSSREVRNVGLIWCFTYRRAEADETRYRPRICDFKAWLDQEAAGKATAAGTRATA